MSKKKNRSRSSNPANDSRPADRMPSSVNRANDSSSSGSSNAQTVVGSRDQAASTDTSRRRPVALVLSLLAFAAWTAYLLWLAIQVQR